MKLMGSIIFTSAIGFGFFMVYEATKIIMEITGVIQ